MTDLFRTVLNMSITGVYIAAAIIILRLFMKKLPKKYSYILWAILGIRLLCPFSFSSAVSVFNVLVPEKPEISSGQMEYIPPDIEYSYEPKVTVSLPPVNETVNTYLPPAEPNNSVNPMQIAMSICTIVWLVGMAAMVIYTVLSYLSVRKRVKNAREQSGIFICDNIETPFVFGIIKPRIYLPENVSEEDMRYIVAHEQAHIRRGDHIVKLIAMAALCVHWFNPMVWISYRLMTKDMELSCDEKALGTFDEDVKKSYANALLNISMRQNKLTLGGVLSFGESDIKSRIKGVLGAKKPKVIVTIIAVIAVIIAAVCLLTNAVKDKKNEYEPIPEGVYVTDKLLYTAPQKDSYWGDNNGMRYSIKDGMLFMSGRESTYKLSEPMEIPFTDEEWDEAFDNYEKIGWQDGEKNLSDYDNKYCFALHSDEEGGIDNYIFVMDGEIWYVQYGWEIYRLKPADEDMDFSENEAVEKETEAEIQSVDSMESPVEYISLCGGYLTDLWNYIGKTGELSPEKYTSDPDMIRLIESIKSSYSESVASENITKIETVIAESNVRFGTVGSRTWVYVSNYGVLWWQGEEIVNREDGYSAYFEITEENGSPEIYRGYELWYLTDLISEDNLTLPIAIDIEDVINAYDSSADNVSFKKISLTQAETYPHEDGGYSFYADRSIVNISFMVPREWNSDGNGSFEHNDNNVMSQYVVYSDSYDMDTKGFTIDMAYGREISLLEEKYGDDNSPRSYYAHTSMDSYYGVVDSHYFIVHSGGYYAVFCFNGNADFNMATAEAILSTVTISPVYLDINLDSMQAALSIIDIGTLQSDGTIKTTGAEGAAEVSFFLPDVWFTNDIPGMYYNKNMFRVESVYKAVPDRKYPLLNGTNGMIPLFGSEVNVMGESYAAEGGNSPYDYMVHKTVNGSECYEYVVTRGDYSAVVHFNADPSSTEVVRNAIIRSIKIEKVPLSDVRLEGIDFSASYDSQSMIVTMYIANNSDREFVAFDEGIEIYENGEYVPVSFFSLNAEEKTSMHIWGGEGLEYYQTMGKMANSDFKPGKYRAVITGYFSDTPNVRSMMYAEFEIE